MLDAPLIIAIKNEDLKTIQEFKNLDDIINRFYTPLIKTISKPVTEPIYGIVSNKGVIDRTIIGYNTIGYDKQAIYAKPVLPLDFAFSKDNMGIINFLLFSGASYQTEYSRIQETELISKCLSNDIKFVKELLKNGKYCKKYKNDALICTIEKGYLEIVKCLIENGAEEKDTALICASKNGYLEIIKYLLAQGANKKNEALKEAIKNNKLDIIDYLLFLGGEYNNLCDEILKNTQLISKCLNNNVTSLKDLLQKGKYCKKYKNDALIYVSKKQDYPKIVKCLIENGADDINNALIFASKNGRKNIVQCLIKHGATKISEAIDIAQEMGHKKITSYLQSL